jgi:beta,beta-carotene 9',10'-dioxygenase
MSGYGIGFASLEKERDATRLPVTGEIPKWLAGTLLRNGPALFDTGRRTFRHWFDGQAMVHRFAIAGGEVTYNNRFLRTEAYRSVRERGRISYTEFATDPCGSIFNRFFSKWRGRVTDNACVNVTRAGDRVLALTETPLPIEFEPDTLATVGLVDGVAAVGSTDGVAAVGSDLDHGHGRGGTTTAHPHLEPATGALVNYSLSFSRQSEYRLHRIRDERYARELIASYGTDRPGYVHSFAITENHVVLAVFPFVVNPLSFLFRDRPFIENFRWQPRLGTRIVVISLAGGGIRGEYRTDACFAFHHINAFERDGELVMDLCAYDDVEIINATYLDRLRGTAPVPVAYPVRYRIDLEGGGVDAWRLAEEPLELPRINYGRHNGRPYRYAYGVGAADPSGANFVDQLVKLNASTGETKIWRAEGCYPGEPVFVPAPSPDGSAGDPAGAEDRGVVLSVVLDAEAARSSLLVLDATTFTELATAHVPHAIPFGFHGQFTHRKPE